MMPRKSQCYAKCLLAVVTVACGQGTDSDTTFLDVPTAATDGSRVAEVDLGLGSTGDQVRLVQEHLTTFGYFPNAELAQQYSWWRPIVTQSPLRGTYDEPTEAAVREYQRRGGLEPTGFVNAATWERIQLARCGVPDSAISDADGTVEKFAHALLVNGVASGWTRGVTVSWNVIDDTSAINPTTSPGPGAGGYDGLLRDAARAAFATWESSTSIHFAEEVDNGPDANIHIRWHDFNALSPAGDGETPDDPNANGIVDIRVNTNNSGTGRTWSVDGSVGAGQTDLESLLLHEIGHAIGLTHSSIGDGATNDPDVDSIMQSGLVRGQSNTRELSIDDKVAVGALYDEWDQLTGTATAIDVGGTAGTGVDLDGDDVGDGSVWILGSTSAAGGYLIYQLTRNASDQLVWERTRNNSGAFDNFRGHRIAVDRTGTPWVIQQNGLQAYRRTTSTYASGTWAKVVNNSCATDIDVGWDNSVWIVGCTAQDLGIRKLSVSATATDMALLNATWGSPISDQASRIAVDGNGVPWVVFSDNTIYRLADEEEELWDELPGAALDITAGPVMQDSSNNPVRYVYVVDNFNTSGGHHLHTWNEQSLDTDASPDAPALSDWVQIDGAAVNISVGPDGKPWVVDSFNNIHKREK